MTSERKFYLAMRQSQHFRRVAELKKQFDRGIMLEEEYYNKRVDLALRQIDDKNRYLAKVHQTKIGERHFQRTQMKNTGHYIISEIMGTDNCLIIAYALGNIYLYWNGRVAVESDKEHAKKNSIYIDAIAYGASVHIYSSVLESI